MGSQIVCHLDTRHPTKNYTKIIDIYVAPYLHHCANKMAQTALQNIATSIVSVPYPSTVLASSASGTCQPIDTACGKYLTVTNHV